MWVLIIDYNTLYDVKKKDIELYSLHFHSLRINVLYLKYWKVFLNIFPKIYLHSSSIFIIVCYYPKEYYCINLMMSLLNRVNPPFYLIWFVNFQKWHLYDLRKIASIRAVRLYCNVRMRVCINIFIIYICMWNVNNETKKIIALRMDKVLAKCRQRNSL